MRRSISLVLMITLLFLTLCGCRGGVGSNAPTAGPSEPTETAPAGTGPAGMGATKTEPTGPVYDDPYPAEAYAYHLGRAADYDQGRDARFASPDYDGTVRQVVYAFEPSQSWEEAWTPLRVWEYEDFPAYVAEEDGDEPAPFRGRYRLAIFASDPLDNVGFWEFVPIRQPSVFGAFEALVMGLDYSAPIGAFDGMHSVSLLLTDADGAETRYDIDRAGNVLRNNEAAAAARLSEAATDYFFALRMAWQLYSYSWTYWYYEDYPEAILRVSSGGRTVDLTKERRDSFAACFSDWPAGQPLPNAVTVSPRCHCGPGDHGEVLATVTYGATDPETGEFTGYRNWTIYEDGHVVYPWFNVSAPCASSFNAPEIFDRLTFDGYLVSVTTFDVLVIETYLDARE